MCSALPPRRSVSSWGSQLRNDQCGKQPVPKAGQESRHRGARAPHAGAAGTPTADGQRSYLRVNHSHTPSRARANSILAKSVVASKVAKRPSISVDTIESITRRSRSAGGSVGARSQQNVKTEMSLACPHSASSERAPSSPDPPEQNEKYNSKARPTTRWWARSLRGSVVAVGPAAWHNQI